MTKQIKNKARRIAAAMLALTVTAGTLPYTPLSGVFGDVAITAHALGYDLDKIFEMNIDKLKARYPDGFDAERSLHRKEGDV